MEDLYYDGRKVIPIATQRYVPGGYVLDVKWAEDSTSPQHRLDDGGVHPAHRAGFCFTVPVCSLSLIPGARRIQETEND